MQSWEPVPSYLDVAKDAARWIRSAGRETEKGFVWLPDPDQPEKLTTVGPASSIYSGNAGTLLFLLELARATGDASYLADAQRGADYVAGNWRDVIDAPRWIKLPNAGLVFNNGLAGLAFALYETWRATQAARYRESALEISRYIVAQAHGAGSGVEWTGVTSTGLGDGSIALFLLWAAQAFEDASYRDLARRAGERILEVAERDADGRRRWTGFPMEQIGLPAGMQMANFEFGTAGVAFVLARLYEETGEQRFLDAAREGAAHVEAKATVRGDAALLRYREPSDEEIYYLGYCHGPVGTARLFYQLQKLTGESEYGIWLERFARGIISSGVPERQAPGLWNVVCQCCGTAGILDFFLSLWLATGKAEHLAYARRVADSLVGRATDVDGKGARWYQAWTRVKPGEVAAETGYMIGAAGVGAALLHLALAEEGRYEAVLFPDNPFPRQQSAAAGSVRSL
jgi:lantibiotic modifying enzyme